MTTVTEVQAMFRANVPDLVNRLEAERLWQAGQDAWVKFSDACEERGVDSWDDDAVAEHDDLKALKDAYDAANQPWLDLEGYGEPVYPDDDYENPHRCALSGLLIHEDDPNLEDENTGERVLKCALGVSINEAGEFDLPAAKSVEAA